MELFGYLLGSMAGLSVLGIFALQVVHLMVEYRCRSDLKKSIEWLPLIMEDNLMLEHQHDRAC